MSVLESFEEVSYFIQYNIENIIYEKLSILSFIEIGYLLIIIFNEIKNVKCIVHIMF